MEKGKKIFCEKILSTYLTYFWIVCPSFYLLRPFTVMTNDFQYTIMMVYGILSDTIILEEKHGFES